MQLLTYIEFALRLYPIIVCCLFSDVYKPFMICPESNVVYTEDGTPQTVDFTSLPRTINDFSEITDVSFSMDNYTFNENDLYQRVPVEMIARDAASNIQSCKFEYTLLRMYLVCLIFRNWECLTRN